MGLTFELSCLELPPRNIDAIVQIFNWGGGFWHFFSVSPIKKKTQSHWERKCVGIYFVMNGFFFREWGDSNQMRMLSTGHTHAPLPCHAVCDPSHPPDRQPCEWAGMDMACSLPHSDGDGAGWGCVFLDSSLKWQVPFGLNYPQFVAALRVVSVGTGT